MEQIANQNSQTTELDSICINTIRFLSIDAIQKANSGHPGLPLDAAPMAYVLWTKFFKHNPKNPAWFDRDRFILSAGHGSMLLYSLLFLTGYDLSLEQIKQFRQWQSLTPGHPERGLTMGVETTTGPLGQGFANGVGMAIAEANLAARFNRPGFQIIDHFTYAIVSDGDLMEGVASEAASVAGHLKLGKLIYLYDNNHVSLSESTNLSFSEDRAARFQAYGWHTQVVEDGNDLRSLEKALRIARQETDRPSFILVNTHLGYGSPNKQDTYEAHGSPLGQEETRLTKQNLNWPTDPAFYIPDQAINLFHQAISEGRKIEERWNTQFNDYAHSYPELASELKNMISARLPDGWDATIPHFPADDKGMASRKASGTVLKAITPLLPSLIGGSADLNPSTLTMMPGLGDFESPIRTNGDTQGSSGGDLSMAGRNLHFGVREHAMASILNGIAAHGGFIPFGSTFLIFSDYARPPIRLAALMGLHVIYVFTHDSVGLGQDGPTHQPIEQLANLRSVPNLSVIRPGDANETAVAWKVAIETRHKPVALVLSRQNLPTLDRKLLASAEGLRRGAYVLADPPENQMPDVILIASGSELSLIVSTQKKLLGQGIYCRLVSMPSWDLFRLQTKDYQNQVLLPDVKARLAIEAGSPQGWHEFVGDNGIIIGIDHFGASAPGEVLMEQFGFTVDAIFNKILSMLKVITGNER
jgi:transketolase